MKEFLSKVEVIRHRRRTKGYHPSSSYSSIKFVRDPRSLTRYVLLLLSPEWISRDWSWLGLRPRLASECKDSSAVYLASSHSKSRFLSSLDFELLTLPGEDLFTSWFRKRSPLNRLKGYETNHASSAWRFTCRRLSVF